MNQSPSEQVNPGQTKIDDESLAMLLEEVSAMAASGQSLVIGMADLEQASLGRVGRAARVIGQRINAGHAPAKAIASLSPKYEPSIRAAMEIMSQTGSTESINETVRLIREEKQQKYEAGLAVINPLLNVLVAAVVAFFVMPWIWVAVSKAEIIKTRNAPTASEIFTTFAESFTFAALATVVVVGCFAALLWWFAKRSSTRIDGARAHATFCRWLAMQIGVGGSTSGSAIELAAGVVGPVFKESWKPSLEKIHGGAQTSDSLALPMTTPEPVKQCVVDLVAASRDRQSIAMDLHELSELYRQTSSRRRDWWIAFFPRIIGSVIVIATIVVLARTIVVPLIDVVTEVVR